MLERKAAANAQAAADARAAQEGKIKALLEEMDKQREDYTRWEQEAKESSEKQR
jgi:hypothetical protein